MRYKINLLLALLLFISLLSLCSAITHADTGFYVEVALTYHDAAAARPEVNLQTPLIGFEIGYQNEDDWSVGVSHTSSLPQDELGDGVTGAFISKRIWLK